jgi:hypothetical protein
MHMLFFHIYISTIKHDVESKGYIMKYEILDLDSFPFSLMPGVQIKFTSVFLIILLCMLYDFSVHQFCKDYVTILSNGT